MKKNIEVTDGCDKVGRLCLQIRKRRGKLTLEEIREVCMDYNPDFYMLVINALGGDQEQYYTVDDLNGDYVTLYTVDDFFTWRKK